MALSPPATLALGFTLLIVIGTGLLMLPMANTVDLRLIDALFTATSAVTVTGLIVVDTPVAFTPFGETVIAVLIQLGGVGLMSFAVLALMAAGGRPALRFQLLIGEALGKMRLGDAARVVRLAFLFAIAFECVGAALLAARFALDMPLPTAIWQGVFHSISAFNNAGFSLFSDSLVGYADDPVVNLVVPAMFIVGGLGFVVMTDPGLLKGTASLHTRLMLRATLILIAGSMVLFWLFEMNNPATLAGADPSAQLMRSWFMATTPRTAGFNTVDVGAMETPSMVLTMWLMFIGGGTGSTAGGIKIATFVVLIIATRAFVAGRTEPTILGRRLEGELVLRAMAITVTAMMGIAVALLLLTVLEKDKVFLDLVFEIVSAFGTVGLSRGITAELSDPSRLLLCVAMFTGRLGPLTLAFLLATARPGQLRYPAGVLHVG